MEEIKVIEGEIFADHRGHISAVNSFDFKDVERFYFIHHPDKSVVRGWHGHQFEKKWFYCVKGKFTLWFVRPDDWENPSPELVPHRFELEEGTSRVIYVPEGHANCIKAEEDDSVLLVYSGKKMPEALEDSWRYEIDHWNRG